MHRVKNILILLITIIFSCDENPFFIDCRDCVSQEPEYATLLVKLDPGIGGGLTPSAVVRIYEGKLEDNNLLGTYYIPGRSWETNVTLNKKYTLTATYTDNHGNTYVAVDSAYPRLRYEKSQCEDACWFVYDRVVKLAIKYSR